VIGPLVSEAEIIELAQEELEPGETLAQLAGIETITLSTVGPDEDREIPARDFFAGEEFKAAMKKLNEGGKVFETFDCSHDGDIRRFVAAAEALGLGQESRELVASATGII
jgi:hypothetical protein